MNVTGPHGLFAVVVTTSWWVATVDADSRGTFDAIVEDLHWVIGNLIHINSKSEATRSEPDTATKTQFPGSSNRDPSKRKIKPTMKVRERS